jgi:lytic cellulose monooxygenase (C1-hydroxylating)
MFTSLFVSALAYASAASAHGYIASVQANGQTYNGYNPAIGPWQPDQVRLLYASRPDHPYLVNT